MHYPLQQNMKTRLKENTKKPNSFLPPQKAPIETKPTEYVHKKN